MISEKLIESTRSFLEAASNFDFKSSHNLNPLLTFLEHVKIREGYVLDHFLCGSRWGGSSRLYVRKKDACIRYTPEENYQKPQFKWLTLSNEFKIKDPIPSFTDDMFIDGEYSPKIVASVPNFQDYFSFDFNEASVWEMNLLKNFLTVYMPKFWHGCYHDAKLILGDKELLNISQIDCSQYMNNSVIQPSVIIESPYNAILSETFFSMWGGLSKIKRSVKYKNNRIEFDYPFEWTNLIEYHCGIVI